MMNKKASSLTSWVFGIIVVLLFLVILQTQVLTPMNSIYNKSFTTGLDTSGLDSFTTLKTSADSKIQGAEVTSTSDGLTLTSAWDVGKGIYSTLTSFISGNFLGTLLTDILDLPPIIAQTLTVMIWISLILIIIYIFMKVVP